MRPLGLGIIGSHIMTSKPILSINSGPSSIGSSRGPSA